MTTAQTCRVEACKSSCHDPTAGGPYCAPARCYCGGCPGYVPLPESPAERSRAYEAKMRDRARNARDDGIAKVGSRKDFGEWETHAIRAIAELVDAGVTFSADDVWDQLGRNGVEPPPEPRALGPVIVRLVKLDRIEHVGFTPSTRRHMTPIRTFRGKAKTDDRKTP